MYLDKIKAKNKIIPNKDTRPESNHCASPTTLNFSFHSICQRTDKSNRENEGINQIRRFESNLNITSEQTQLFSDGTLCKTKK